MPEIEITFGGLRSLEYDERVDIDHALTCDDCCVDYGGIQPRNGYRAATASPPGSGLVQGVWRFRPKSPASAPNDARTIIVRGGNTLAVTDPSSELLSDGTSATPAGEAAFGATAQISACQLGKYLYIGSDTANTAWQRVTPTFTMQSIASLPQGATPTVAFSSLAVVAFNSLAAGTAVNSTVSTVFTSWFNVQPTNVSNSLTFNYGAPASWQGDGWLAVMMTPQTQSSANDSITVSISSAPTSGFELLGTIYDTPGTDSPCVIYFPLTGVTQATLAAVQYIQFSCGSLGQYEVYGSMLVPITPQVGIQQYFLDTFSSTSLQTSGLYPPLNTAGVGGINVSFIQNNITIPTFPAVVGRGNGFASIGTLTLDPTVLVNQPNRFFNASAPTAYPTRSAFASLPTFSGTAPAGTYDTLRLWKQTTTGIRLVKAIAQTPGGAFSVTDDQGIFTLTNQLYVPGGSPPACITMCAAGGRLIAAGDPANPARFSVSSYLAFGSDTDPFPQFPAIPTLITDGWSADLAPTSAEQILWCGYGDSIVYMISNEGCYALASTDAPLYGPPPFQEVWHRGVIGRQAACWAEDRLFWAAHDGVYMARNRSYGGELTGSGNPNLPEMMQQRVSVNRIYRTWLQPDATTVVSYQDRRLFIQRGNLFMRYDFNSNTWSRGTLANSMNFSAAWRDPNGVIEHLWYYGSDGNLHRWQPGTWWADTNRATSDNGTAINNWTYSTGYDTRTIRSLTEGYGNFKTRVQFIWTETDGAVTVSIYLDNGATAPRTKTVGAGMHEVPVAPDLKSYVFRVQYSGTNSVRLLRGMWSRNKVDSKGGI